MAVSGPKKPAEMKDPHAEVSRLAKLAKRKREEYAKDPTIDRGARYQNTYTEAPSHLATGIKEFKQRALKRWKDLEAKGEVIDTPAPATTFEEKLETICQGANTALGKEFQEVLDAKKDSDKERWEAILETEYQKLEAEFTSRVAPGKALKVVTEETKDFLDKEKKQIKEEKLPAEMKRLNQSMEDQKDINDQKEIKRKALLEAKYLPVAELNYIARKKKVVKGEKLIWRREGDVDPEEIKRLNENFLPTAAAGAFDEKDFERVLNRLREAKDGNFKSATSNNYINLDNGVVYPRLPVAEYKEAYDECIDFLKIKGGARSISISYDKPAEALNSNRKLERLHELVKSIRAKECIVEIPADVEAALVDIINKAAGRWVAGAGKANLAEAILKLRDLTKITVEMTQKAKGLTEELGHFKVERDKLEAERNKVPAPSNEDAVKTVIGFPAAGTPDAKVKAVEKEIVEMEARQAQLQEASKCLDEQIKLMPQLWAKFDPSDPFFDEKKSADPDARDPHIVTLGKLSDEIKAELKDLETRRNACASMLGTLKSPPSPLTATESARADKALEQLGTKQSGPPTVSTGMAKTLEMREKESVDAQTDFGGYRNAVRTAVAAVKARQP